jgi:steroid delta-isomerase-like uncharacterized protein
MKKTLMILPLAFLLLFIFSCQDKAAMEELEAFKVQAEQEQKNLELIKNMIKEIDNGNIDILNEMYAEECQFFSPSDADPMSKADVFAGREAINKAFPKWKHDVKDLIAKDDKVILWSVDITQHEGEYMGIPASGEQIKVGSIAILRIKDGKIVEVAQEFNNLGLMMQLGFELKPKEEK